jgi:hypothetical protein
VLLAPLVHTYSLIEKWNRKRLAFIRANHILEGDAAFVEYLRGKIYEEANASALGSKELAEIASQYSAAKGKANLYQAAKTSAARTFEKSKTDALGAHPKPEKVRFKEKPRSYPKGPGPREPKRKVESSSLPPRSGRYLRHRLRDQVAQWAQIGGNSQVLSWIKHGVAIQWMEAKASTSFQSIWESL